MGDSQYEQYEWNTRILVARPDHIGDALLTLPMLTRVKRALPAAHISFLVPRGSAEVALHCPYVDETICAYFPPLDQPLDVEAWSRRAEEQAAPLQAKFDAAILPRPDDPWSGPLVSKVKVPIRLGYASPRTIPYLTHALPAPAKCHVSDLGLRLAEGLIALLCSETGLRGDHGGDHGDEEAVSQLFVPTPEEEAEAERALSEVADRTGRRPVVLHPGAGWTIKLWPSARWGRLARLLAGRYGTSPLVVTGPGEEQLERSIIEESGGIAVRLARPLPLGALAALHRHASLVVGIDSGPLHLAAMMGCSVVGLYGPADPAEFRPLCTSAEVRTVAVRLPCSPCGTLLNPPCGVKTKPACMTGISVEQVFQAVIEALDQVGDNATHTFPVREGA